MIITDNKRIKVYNNTAEVIPAHKVVIIEGKSAVLASYTNGDCLNYPLAFTLKAINPSQYEEVVLEGTIENLPTSTFGSRGTILYLSTDGAMTTTAPTPPIIVGAISYEDAVVGTIYFNVITPTSDKVPYTGATSDVDLGVHSITMNDGTYDTEMSPAFFGVEINGGTRFSLLEYNQLTISDSTVPSSMIVTTTGITFPDGSIQTTAATSGGFEQTFLLMGA